MKRMNYMSQTLSILNSIFCDIFRKINPFRNAHFSFLYKLIGALFLLGVTVFSSTANAYYVYTDSDFYDYRDYQWRHYCYWLHDGNCVTLSTSTDYEWAIEDSYGILNDGTLWLTNAVYFHQYDGVLWASSLANAGGLVANTSPQSTILLDWGGYHDAYIKIPLKGTNGWIVRNTDSSDQSGLTLDLYAAYSDFSGPFTVRGVTAVDLKVSGAMSPNSSVYTVEGSSTLNLWGTTQTTKRIDIWYGANLRSANATANLTLTSGTSWISGLWADAFNLTLKSGTSLILQAASADITGTKNITVESGATLNMNSVGSNTNVNVILNGGTLVVPSGYTGTIGTLTVNTEGSVLDLGSGTTSLTVTNLVPNKKLTVNNWDMWNRRLYATGIDGTPTRNTGGPLSPLDKVILQTSYPQANTVWSSSGEITVTTGVWDNASVSNNAINGGAGTWDSTTTNWTNWNGTGNSQWMKGDAIFNTGSGIVTVSGTQNVGNIYFDVTSYDINGGTLAAQNNLTTLYVGPANDSTSTTVLAAGIQSVLTGNNFIKTGKGDLYLRGENTYTGTTTVSYGTLVAAQQNTLPSTTDVVVNANGTLALRTSQIVRSLDSSAGTLDCSTGYSIVRVTGGTSKIGTMIGHCTFEVATGAVLQFTKTTSDWVTIYLDGGTLTFSPGVTVTTGYMYVRSDSTIDFNASGNATLNVPGNLQTNGLYYPSWLSIYAGVNLSVTNWTLGSDFFYVNGSFTGGNATIIDGSSYPTYTANTPNLSPLNRISINSQNPKLTIWASDSQITLASGYWDGSDTTADNTVDGGAGTWNATNTNWTNLIGSLNTKWAGNGLTAVFKNTGGVVNVVGTQDIGGIQAEIGGLDINGTGTLNGTASPTVLSNTSNVGIGAILAGGDYEKQGARDLYLSGNNTFTGTMNVKEGWIVVKNANTFGATSKGTTVQSGAAIWLATGITTAAEPLTLNGTGIDSKGALSSLDSNNEYAGKVTLGSAGSVGNPISATTLTISGTIDTAGYTLTSSGVGNVTLKGVISGSGGLTKANQGTTADTGTGTLTLNAANTYTGNTTVSTGTLTLGIANALPSATGTGTVTVASGATLKLAGYSQTLNNSLIVNGTLDCGGGSVILSGGNSTITAITTPGVCNITVNSGATLTLSSSISNTSVNITLNGGTLLYGSGTTHQLGTLKLTANSTVSYKTGNKNVTFETLDLGAYQMSVTNWASGSDHFYVKAITSTSEPAKNTVNVAPLNQINFNPTADSATYYGLPATYWTTDFELLAAMNYWDGPRTTSNNAVDGGTSTWNSSTTNWTNATGSANGVWGNLSTGLVGVFKGTAGTVTVSGTQSIGGLTFSVTGYSLTGGSLSGVATTNVLTTDSGVSATIATVLDGTQAWEKKGSGSLELSGVNTFSGALTVTAGTLIMSNAQAFGSSASGTSVTSGASLALKGGISAAEALTINGAGMNSYGALYSLSGNSSHTGAITLGSDSTIGNQADATNFTLAGAIDNAGKALTLTTSISSTANIKTTGMISGSGALNKTGANTVTLAAANTFSGNTTISAGTLALGIENGLPSTASSGTVTVASGATLKLAGFNQTLKNALIVNGTLDCDSGSTLTLDSGTHSIAKIVSTTGACNIVVNTGATLTLTDSISNTSVNIKLNGGKLTVSAGKTQSLGTLSLTADSTVDMDSSTSSYASLTVASLDISTFKMAVTNWSSGNDHFYVTTINSSPVPAKDTVNIVPLNQITMGSGDAKMTTWSSTANELVSAAGNYWDGAGTTANNVVGGGSGTWNGANTNWTNSSGSANGVWPGGAVAIFQGTAGTVTVSGALNIGGLTFNTTGYVLNSGTLTGIATDGNTLTIDGTSATVDINSVLAGGSYEKKGSGRIQLYGTNTYSGATTVSEGTLMVANNNALGSTSSGTTVKSGASVALRGGLSGVVEPLTLNGTGVDGNGALYNYGSTNSTYSGAITLDSDSTIGNANPSTFTISGSINNAGKALTFVGGNTDRYIVVSGAISGSGAVTKTGTNTVTLGAANTYTGTTTVSAGTLAIGIDNGLPSSSTAGVVTVASGATLKLAGYKQTLYNDLNVNGTLDCGGTTLTLAGGVTTINSSTINISSGTCTIIVNAGATLVLNSSISNTSLNITLNGGTLKVVAGTSQSLGTLSQTAASTIDFDASTGSYATLTVATLAPSTYPMSVTNWTLGSDHLYATSVSGTTLKNTANIAPINMISLAGNPASLTIWSSSANEITIPGTYWDGSNTSSNSAIDGGTGSWDSSSTNWTNASGSVNSVWGGGIATFKGAAGTVTVTGTQSIEGLTFNTSGYTLNGGTLTGSTTITNALTIDVSLATINSVLAGGEYEKKGSGEIDLYGVNTYTGTTTVSGGILVLANNQALGATSSGTIVNSGASLALRNTLSGVAEPLTLNGTGVGNNGALYNLDSTNSKYSGPITLASDSLIGNLNPSTFTISGTINNGGNAATFTGAGINRYITVDGIISGSGSLTKIGTNTLTLTGANTYSGATIVSEGGLTVSNALGLGSNAAGTTVGSLGALQLSGGITISSEELTLNGGVLSNVSGNNTYSGTITLTQDAKVSNNGASNDILTLGGSIATGGKLLNLTGNVNTSNLTVRVSGVISGNGSVLQDGGITTELRSANTYTGSTTISSGKQVLYVDNGLPVSSSVTVAAGATLDISSYNQTLSSGITVNGTLNGAGGTLTLSGSDSSIVAITGNLTIVVKSGATLTLSESLSNAGVNIRLDGGTLKLTGGKTYGLGTLSQTAASTVDFSSSGDVSLTVNTLTVNGYSLSASNWSYNKDHFFATNFTGASRNTIGSAPMNAITLGTNSKELTVWQSSNDEITALLTPKIRISTTTYGGVGIFRYNFNALSKAMDTITTTVVGTAVQGDASLTGTAGLEVKITQTAPEGWSSSPASASCIDANGSTTGNGSVAIGTLSGNVLTIPAESIRAGVDFTCNFINRLNGLYGKVFNDGGAPVSGVNTGTPNDGIVNGSEGGIGGLMVSLTDCNATTYASTTTDGNGVWNLNVPTGVSAGTPVCITAGSPASYTITGASSEGNALLNNTSVTVNGTSFTYIRATQSVKFASPASGSANLDFGVVPRSTFVGNGAKTGVQGVNLDYAHTFTAGTGGSLAITTSDVSTPTVSGWTSLVYTDPGCTGARQSTATLLTSPLTVVQGEVVCLIVRVTPAITGVDGNLNVTTVTANLTLTNANPSLSASYSVTDTTTLGNVALSLLKEVRNLTTGGAWGTTNQAKSGDLLEYRITYTNNSASPMTTLILTDTTPSYTTFRSAQAGTTPTALGACMKKTPQNTSSNPEVECAVVQGVGGKGTVQWRFDGVLEPSATGDVKFKVMVE
jgi:fibronectin-binding autotransporter adhesin